MIPSFNRGTETKQILSTVSPDFTDQHITETILIYI